MSEVEIRVETKEEHTFIKKKHELTKLLKSLEKASEPAVTLLVATMNNPEIDIKVRIGCAEKLLAFNTSVAQQISADEMARMVAEIKLAGGATKTLTIEGADKPKIPVLNFNEISEV